jgi:hypothetical protein
MNFTSNQQILICIIIGIIIIFLFYKQSENFATSTEALNNIASLYNTGNLTATNINATGSMGTTNLTASGYVSADNSSFNRLTVNQNATICGASFVPGGAIGATNLTASGYVSADNSSFNKLNVNQNATINGAKLTNTSNVLPIIIEPTILSFDTTLISWANRTGCGGLMSKGVAAGTQRSFLLNFGSDRSGWAAATVTLIDGTGAYIMSLDAMDPNQPVWKVRGTFTV